jgi:ribonuclease HI
MIFKGQRVWVRSDAAGRPELDADGRAEMKYRETDPKSYRPGLGNLSPDETARAEAPRDFAEPVARLAAAGAVADAGAATAAAPRARPSRARTASRAASNDLEKLAGAVEIWTDGACSGNPGPMGIGVVVIDGKVRKELGEYLGSGTNNIAELVAIERGVELADEVTGGDPQRPLRVYTDSSYAIGLLEQGWKAKANQELVARIREGLRGRKKLSFVKVRGHAGVPENERCDELARLAVSRGMMPRSR